MTTTCHSNGMEWTPVPGQLESGGLLEYQLATYHHRTDQTQRVIQRRNIAENLPPGWPHHRHWCPCWRNKMNPEIHPTWCQVPCWQCWGTNSLTSLARSSSSISFNISRSLTANLVNLNPPWFRNVPWYRVWTSVASAMLLQDLRTSST